MTSADDLAAATRYVTDAQLKEGIALAHGGERERAREAFRRVIQRNPEEELAWLWLARVSETSEDARRYLLEAQTILPSSVRIAEALRVASDATGSGETHTRRHRTYRVAAHRRLGAGLVSLAEGLIQAGSRAGPLLSAWGRAIWHGTRWLVHRIAHLRIPEIHWGAVGRRALIVLAIASATVLSISIRGWALRAREQVATVLAEALPTVDPHVTPTQSVNQRLEPLWLEADSAITVANWEAAAEALQRIRDTDPGNIEARQKLAAVCYRQAEDLVAENALEEAQAMLDEAVRLDAACPGVAEERRVLNLYLDGLDAYWTRDWENAVAQLRKVQNLPPDFKDTRAMLGQAYYEVGVCLQADRQWFAAQESMERCLALLPDHEGASERLVELDRAITPPRRIEVSLSQFTCTLYEDDQPFRTFVICHGRRSAPTIPGRYEIQSKIPTAYGSAWDLWMPYWLGIYNAGGTENGLHALPILESGAVLWEGALGTRCSFGCIVLDTADAEYLYNWADIGTVVFVRE